MLPQEKKEMPVERKFRACCIDINETGRRYFSHIVNSCPKLEMIANTHPDNLYSVLINNSKAGKDIDFLLMDIQGDDGEFEGIKMIAGVRKKFPEIPILVLTKHSEKYQVKALSAGDFYKIAAFDKYLAPDEVIIKTIDDFLTGSEYALLWNSPKSYNGSPLPRINNQRT